MCDLEVEKREKQLKEEYETEIKQHLKKIDKLKATVTNMEKDQSNKATDHQTKLVNLENTISKLSKDLETTTQLLKEANEKIEQ